MCEDCRNRKEACEEKCGIITNEKKIREIFGCTNERCQSCKDNGKCDIFEIDNFHNWEYDMRLGNEYYTTTEDVPRILDKRNPYAIIKPGEFGLLITKESIKMPNDLMAFISIKFTYKQKGLINISGFHVDPCYNGKIIFSVYNAGPNDIVLKYNDPVFMIFFQQLDKGIGKETNNRNFDKIPTEMVSAIRGRSVSLATNASRIDKLEFYFKFYGGIAGSLIIALLGVLIANLLGN